MSDVRGPADPGGTLDASLYEEVERDQRATARRWPWSCWPRSRPGIGAGAACGARGRGLIASLLGWYSGRR